MSADNFITIKNVNCVHHTKDRDGAIKAIKVKAIDLGGLRWIPFSMVHDDSDVWHTGDRGDLIVNYDFVQKQGWIE